MGQKQRKRVVEIGLHLDEPLLMECKLICMCLEIAPDQGSRNSSACNLQTQILCFLFIRDLVFVKIATTVDTNAHCNTIELERLETK